MSAHMRAAVVRAIGSWKIEEIPHPVPAKDEVVVEVAVAGLCRTDVKLVDVGHRDLTLPRVPAEEVVGTVCRVGSAPLAGLLGKRVYVYPGTSCGTCERCRQGAGNLCVSMRIMGFHRDGGFAEFVSTPAASLIELPPDLAFDDAVFAEPLSCCLNALELARVAPGDRVGIWGAGTAGTLLGRAARARGAAVTVIEPDPARRERAGAVEHPVADAHFDVAIPAVGDSAAYRAALSSLAPRGRLVAFSGLAADAAGGLLDVNRLHYLEQTCVGAYGCAYPHSVEAVATIAAGTIAVHDLVSHRMRLDDLAEALELVRQRACMKILIYPNTDKKEPYGHKRS